MGRTLRRLLAGAAAGVGALALGNRLLVADDLEAPLGREPQLYQWRGFDVAYTEAGDPDDPDLLLLHGVNAAASSHEFRRVVDALAEEYHVVAPDLPGFGHSDRPPLVYSGALYVAFVTDVARDLTDDPVCVASSLTGAYAALAARDRPDAFGELVLVCPTATTVPGRRLWLRTLLRTPLVGQALFNAMVSKPAIRYFLTDHGFHDEANVTEEWVDYDWATAHRPGARFAPASFVSGYLDVDDDLGAVLADLDVPTTLVWGREAELPPLEAGRELARRAAVRLVVLDDADLLPHAEHPRTFVDVVLEQTARA